MGKSLLCRHARVICFRNTHHDRAFPAAKRVFFKENRLSKNVVFSLTHEYMYMRHHASSGVFEKHACASRKSGQTLNILDPENKKRDEKTHNIALNRLKCAPVLWPYVYTICEQAIEEMLAYAHETQHEKIIRGVAMGMALIMYGREEGADTLIEQLTRS